MKKKYKYIILAIVAFFWTWAFIVEPLFITEVEKATITSPRWDSKLDGLKIGLLGDIHGRLLPFEEYRIIKRVKILQEQSPDIIFLLGDYLDGSSNKIAMHPDDMAKIISQLKAPYGVYAILGNHDSFYSRSKVRKMLRQAGITVIENSNVKIKTPNGDFYVSAIADAGTSSYSYRAAFNKIPKNAPVIFLTHNPDVLREIPERAAISFSGHTHGGQIRLPFYGAFITHSIHGPENSDELLEMDGKLLYINKGIGMSRLPLRFLCPPTISIIELKKGNISVCSPQPNKIKRK